MKITDNEIRQRYFKNHVATHTKLSEKVSILEWKEPGNRCYYVRYVMDGYMLYISGDLGDAVFGLTWNVTPESFKSIGLHYFYEKLSAYDSDKKDFDSEQAIKDLEEAFVDCEEEEYAQLFEDLKELANECSRVDEWAYEGRDRFGSELEEFDQDYWEWIYDIGAVIPSRIRAYLVGLKMAAEQLEAK